MHFYRDKRHTHTRTPPDAPTYVCGQTEASALFDISKASTILGLVPVSVKDTTQPEASLDFYTFLLISSTRSFIYFFTSAYFVKKGIFLKILLKQFFPSTFV